MLDSVKKRGMKVNVRKTKLMVFARSESTTECGILIEGQKVEKVKDFVYQDSLFTNDGKHDRDIERRHKGGAEYDPYCDPDNPIKVEYEEVLAASRRMAGAVVRTPCPLSHLSEKLNMDLYMKQEFLQYTGSFKERGVRNTMLLLDDLQRRKGVVAASTGNHAQAMSYHTTDMGIPCAVVMPETSPITKISKCERYGAKTILHGQTLAEAKRFAMSLANEKGMIYVNGYDHPHVVAGQGTAGIEIVQDVPDVDAVLIPIGGGSLVCGVAIAVKHLKPDAEIYGLGTEKCHSMMDAVKQKERIFLTIDCSLADGLAVNKVGVNTFFSIMCGGLVDKMVQVKEEWVARAIMHIVESERIVVEGSAAVGVAAIMAGLLPNLKGKKVVTILTGGNIDTTILSRALERGMAAEGRLVKFKVTVTDRPGGMAELCSRLADIGVCIKDCIPERAWVKADVFSVQMKVLCETKGWDHTNKLVDTIKRHYKEYTFTENIQDKSSKRGPCLARNPVCMRK
ncbi:hypothetical protein EVAR_65872_1 [Eumeta japonica]|uniref:Serine racemase n=1 Tax=Eumeta variegata TaxID=151549 RepID=A0A4C1ZDG3_EUMVA|nr:hypothetical protein EVAR_65872_1 [Eumeta japonica]